jgi:hypothetical protein
MTYRTSLPLHPTEDDKPKTKRQEKKILKAKAKATGKPYQKPTRKSGVPGAGLRKIGAKMVVAGGIASGAAKTTGGENRGMAIAGAGAATIYASGIKKSMKRNQPTAKPVTKKNTRKNITKTRHVTPTGVTRTKTKTYKKR